MYSPYLKLTTVRWQRNVLIIIILLIVIFINLITGFYGGLISQLPNLCTGIRRICMWVRSVSRCYRP